MHPLMFQLKRAHLRAIEGARALSRKTGLTPARYDLLRALCRFASGNEQEQKRLWRALGVSRTSVSKMVRRMEALGLVTRRRAPRDRRTYLVAMTREGDRRYRKVFRITWRRRPLQRRFERAFGERSWNSFFAVRRLMNNLERTAKHLGDTSWRLYVTKAPGRDRMRPRPRLRRTSRADAPTGRATSPSRTRGPSQRGPA